MKKLLTLIAALAFCAAAASAEAKPKPPRPAPEFDTSNAASPLALLGGGLLVLTGARRRRSTS